MSAKVTQKAVLAGPGDHLGPKQAQGAKKTQKVTSWTPPRGAKGGHFGALFGTFTVPFWVSCFGIVFSSFLEPSGAEKGVFSM